MCFGGWRSRKKKNHMKAGSASLPPKKYLLTGYLRYLKGSPKKDNTGHCFTFSDPHPIWELLIAKNLLTEQTYWKMPLLVVFLNINNTTFIYLQKFIFNVVKIQLKITTHTHTNTHTPSPPLQDNVSIFSVFTVPTPKLVHQFWYHV